MKLTVVKEVPKTRSIRTNVIGYVEEFMKMNVKVVKIDFNEKEYKSPYSCQGSFTKAIKLLGYPITATTRNKEVFLIRNDM